MRLIRNLFLLALGLILFALALANREFVTLRLMTDDAAALMGIPNQISLPLFAVIFVALVAGILVGLVWEWFREHQFRADAAAQRRKADALSRDLANLRAPANANGKPEDDILALVDGHK